MNSAFQPQIILLREGTDTSQGKSQIISNINACQAVAETVRTTLGPRGMDKLVYDGQRVTISNDGCAACSLLERPFSFQMIAGTASSSNLAAIKPKLS
jgi:T-complex protein 1 subunit eta